MITTTVVCAFSQSWQDAQNALVDGRVAASAHAAAVHEAAAYASRFLESAAAAGDEPLGFTCHASFGGGAGWDTEAGVTFVFAGLSHNGLDRVVGFAKALKSREAQQAVVLLHRHESFELL